MVKLHLSKMATMMTNLTSPEVAFMLILQPKYGAFHLILEVGNVKVDMSTCMVIAVGILIRRLDQLNRVKNSDLENSHFQRRHLTSCINGTHHYLTEAVIKIVKAVGGTMSLSDHFHVLHQ